MDEKPKILVVDDSLTMRTVIRRELGEDKYQMMEAKNGLEVLELVKSSFLPDLITLDIDMPKLNGFDTCEKLYSEQYACYFTHIKDGRVPIIFVTSSDNLRDRKRGFELGALDFVTKPFEEGELLKLVTKILHPDDRLKGITALLVDDSKSARMVVSKGLREEGIGVIEAEDGHKAFEIMCNKMSQIDIVITDIEMPGMNGGELCQKIRKELGMIDIPIIFFTGIADRFKLLEVFQAGGTDYLVKPFMKEEMISRLIVHVEKTQLNRRLRKSINELRENMRFKNDMIAVLSHDMRTPLNGIIGFSNLLLQREDRDSEDKESIVLIKESGRILLNLINDILELSKIQAEKAQLEMKPVALSQIAEKSVRALNFLAELKNQKIELELRLHNSVILGNHDALMRVLNNLLANSIKFTPEKGAIRIIIEPGLAGQVKLSVLDTGIGIPADKLPFLFDKYSRISQKGTAGEAGTGLGMSIVKEIVEMHGGTVAVSSRVGEGTQFHISIPQPANIRLQEYPDSEVRTEKENKTADILERIKGLKVLLAEDNPVNQQIAKIILTKSGCVVKKANDGVEAVAIFIESPSECEVIFMDMEMPEMDGVEATRAIREKGFNDIPIIAMTASSREEDKEKCLQAGMNDFITKPISQVAILEVLGKIF